MLLLLSTLMLGFMHVWGSSTWSGGLSKDSIGIRYGATPLGCLQWFQVKGFIEPFIRVSIPANKSHHHQRPRVHNRVRAAVKQMRSGDGTDEAGSRHQKILQPSAAITATNSPVAGGNRLARSVLLKIPSIY